MQAATARFIAVKEVTTVVVTSTITGQAADSVPGSSKANGLSYRRASAVLLILVGAAAGAALLEWHLSAVLALSGAVTLVVVVLGAIHARHHEPS